MKKAFTDIFIQRPVLAIVISLVILIAGIQASMSLNVRQYPRNDNAVVKLTTVYVGASAELVRGFITVPLERAVSAADGIDYIQSQSAQGLSTISIRLKLNYDPIKALAEISAKVDQVRNDLPPEAEVPTLNVESADSQFASAYLSFSSSDLQPNEITDYLVRVVQPQLSALPGVQRAEILGARTFAMRIWLKPGRMAWFNISPTQVQQALARNNVAAALGSTKGNLVQVNLVANTQLHSVEEFKRLVVAEKDGALIRLEDIADVVLGAEDYNTDVRFSGETAMFIGIWPLPNANALDVIGDVTAQIEAIQQQLPTGLKARVAYDATAYINNAIEEVIKTLTETLIIVVIVIFLFLGSMRSALIPIIAIPLSLLGGVFIMQMAGFSLNLLTLLAIVLSVGLVVDDAIVVVENVQRHLSDGESAMNAALKAARELVGPIIAMTVTLAAVYTPIGFQGGLTGSLFREFALTLAGAVTISGVVALTLSPMLSSRFLKPHMDEQGFPGTVAKVFNRVSDRYSRVLASTLNARPIMYVIWLVISLLTIPMFKFSAVELAPTEDQGVIFGIVSAPANATLESTTHFTAAANEIFLNVPETDFTFQITNPSSGFSGLVTKPWADRSRNVFEIMPDIQGPLMSIPGIELFPVTPPALPGGGQFPVEFVVAGSSEAPQLLEIAQQLQQKATESGLFAFPPMIDVKIDQPQTELVIDHEKVADLGLDLQQVSQDLGIMLGGGFVNRFDMAGRSYKVIPQIKRAERLNPEQLRSIYLTGPKGQLISVSSIATLKNTTVPRSLNRMQQFNAVTLSGVAIQPLDTALKFLETEAVKLLPPGHVMDYTGESRQLRKERNTFLPAFGMAILLIFLVLAAQFNSFRDPLVILAGSVPLAVFGALIFTVLKMPNPNLPFFTNSWTTTLNIYSQVGMVTLVGLVAKNGILIVEFANHLQEQGKSKLEAIHDATLIRLRPILMTSIATIAGHFPLTLVTGAGAAARNSIGLVLVGGMAVGTFFTLLVLPSLYMLIARDHRRDKITAPESA
jgi:multidrug efflux pump